jgi:predicted metalloprotease with PDZ domain
MPSLHKYSIVALDPAAHMFEVTVTVQSPDPNGQAFAMAAWVPGSYMIRDFARHVVSIRAASAGQEIGLTRIDKSGWLADPCHSALTLTLAIYAFEPGVRGAHLDTTHGFFDGAAVFPVVVGQEQLACELDIRPPGKTTGGDWRVATSMQALDAGKYEFGTYQGGDFAELIDHPVEMGNLLIGEFDVAGIPHAIAVRGHTRFDMARICHDLATLCETQIGFLGAPQDLDRYVFLLNVQEDGYGGLEHRWSSSLVCSRSDLPRRGDSRVSDDYRKFLGLCSHEYFHLWNIKRIRPEQFAPAALSKEVYTGLLWVFEGITSYYDDLLLLRSGLISTDSYLELLGRKITRHFRNRGNALQSVEESSFYAWTKFYKRHANSGNSTVSYYIKGALIALVLDLTIRKDTDGKKSLDDVLRECWKLYGETGSGMPERGIEAVARRVSGLDLEDFFERYVRGTTDLPLQVLLKSFGVVLHTRPSTGSRDTGGKPASADAVFAPWLGAELSQQGSRHVFGAVHSDSPAERAGLAPGDEAVAIDGLRLTAANRDARLRDHHPGDTVTITVFRDEALTRHKVRLGKPPENVCYLLTDADEDSATRKLHESWIGSD